MRPTCFSAHGGKLIFYHGMSDQAFSAMDTLDYYQRMAKANGGMDQVQDWSRFFLGRHLTPKLGS